MTTTRVLVVDDEANARTALAELLLDEGYSVALAADGQEALAKVAAFLPHVVLSDVKMPRLSGTELRAALAAKSPVPLVVLMSAHEPLGIDADALFLRKPLAIDELLSVIEQAAARVRQGLDQGSRS